MASGYRLIIGFLVMIFVSLLWIPLNYSMSLAGGILNTGLADPDAVSRNNTVVMAFYYTLFILILAIVLYVIKPGQDNDEQGGVAYAPNTPY